MATKTLTISKDPQCRHNERLFVTYESQAVAGFTQWRAKCSNCGSVGAWIVPIAPYPDDNVTKQNARDNLMKIEAKPLTGGGFTP